MRDAGGSEVSGGADALIEAAQAEITVEAMDEELDSIVQYDRLSGDPGEFAAVNYLGRTLEAEGIQVSVDTFLAYISDPVSATVEVPGTDFAPEAITVSGSGTVRDLRGQAVDLGSLGDLPPFLTETGERLILDAQGPAGSASYLSVPEPRAEIALVTGQPRPGPGDPALAMGAAGVVFINPEERLNDLTTTTVWGGPSLLNYHRIPTLPVAEIKRSDGDRLRAMLSRGPVELRMSTETRTGWKPLHLAIGHHPRAHRRRPLRSGRWSPGCLAPRRDRQRRRQRGHAGDRPCLPPTPGPTLREDWWWRGGPATAMVATPDPPGSWTTFRRTAPPGRGPRQLRRTGPDRRQALRSQCHRLAVGVDPDVVAEEVGDSVRTSPPGRNSDQSFNGVGLPLLQLNHSRLAEDGGYWWWHTPDDTRDKVSAEVLKVDADLYVAALGRLLAAPVLPVSLSATGGTSRAPS